MDTNERLQNVTVSRRMFMKGLTVLGAAATVAGCSKDDNAVEYVEVGGGSSLEGAITPTDISNPDIYWAGCVHNCGAGVRCVSKLHVVNDKVVRVTSDDSDYAYDGTPRDKEQWNDSRSLTCAKGRAYKYRLYHPGRLKYALKQTKQRGDVSGFVRITTEQAMKEVAQKYRAIYSKFGPGAILNSYGTSATYGGTFSNPGSARAALTTFVGGTRGTFSDYSYHQYNFAWPLTGHPTVGSTYSNTSKIGSQFEHIADTVKNIVSWGTNVLTTNNTVAYPYIRVVEKMKARNPEGKVIFIGPEFVDTGVTLATDWLQLRNYTDTALIMSLLYDMIVNTFNEDGTIKANPYLDVNYLDTMVYGFFDSPEYWVNTTDGTISLTLPASLVNYRKVDAVPAGKSLSAYVMGKDDRLTKSSYSASANYTATQFATVQGFRNGSTCSYNVKGQAANTLTAEILKSSKYLYKQDFLTPKTPEWAEKITGTPAGEIRKLAKMYCDPAQHPIFNEWCGGVQKQDNGVVNIFAIAALLCVTKTFGLNGEGLFGPWASSIDNAGTPESGSLSSTGSTPNGRPGSFRETKKLEPSMSCKEWFNGIKLAFHDVLIANGYTGKHIPNWDKSTRYVNDDAGAKAAVLLKRDTSGNPLTFIEDGKTYYDYEKDTDGKPIFVGTRMILNSSGGIQLNQHSNTNDNSEMYKCLPISGDPTDADTFCLVQFDVYLSPTARFADYVLPATIALEAGDWMSIGGQSVYRPPVSKAPGEAKDGWRLTYEAYKAQSELGSFNGVDTTDAHFKYVGTAATYQSAEALSMKIVDDARTNPSSKFYGMSRKEVFANQYKPRKNELEATSPLTKSTLRSNLDTYLALDDNVRKTTPFVFSAAANKAEANTSTTFSGVHNTSAVAEDFSTKPNFAGRFQVYNNTVVWEYTNRQSKYHGWLAKDERGQKNADREGDFKVYPIPMYFNFEDSFNEAYGVFDGKSENDLSKKGGLTLSTTHDRYRVHSSMAENPYLRELNHRTIGGKWASGNDWKEYAVMPERHVEGSTANISPMVSSAVYKKDFRTASWHEIWINTEDANERGIKDGDLIKVENPIGAVRVIARVTNRCIRGHVNLHQGGWYDPNPKDGIDDGGCANTLMSSLASRYDHGNSQQMAYVTISKTSL